MTVFLNKYRSSLKTLISGNASNNRTISRNKFIDLLKGSGIDIEEGIKEALIGKMAVKAKNIM